LVLLGSAGFTAAATPADAGFAAAARGVFHEAQARHEREPKNLEAAWQFARACFDAGEYATNSTERAELAEQGIAASQKLLEQSSNSAPGHYYLGMNMGQLARTKTLGALKLVDQMEHEFSVARDLDEHFDYAGPDRNLGLLYREAPSIGSIGSRTKARQHLQRAVELAGEYPDNRLNLVETYLGWNERDNARRELKATELIWPVAQTHFTGPFWAVSWADWDPRLESARKKVDALPKTPPVPEEKP
jgi:hypothetical protein